LAWKAFLTRSCSFSAVSICRLSATTSAAFAWRSSLLAPPLADCGAPQAAAKEKASREIFCILFRLFDRLESNNVKSVMYHFMQAQANKRGAKLHKTCDRKVYPPPPLQLPLVPVDSLLVGYCPSPVARAGPFLRPPPPQPSGCG
jgi:hypothetical protein